MTEIVTLLFTIVYGSYVPFILTHYVACNLSNMNEGTERFIFAHTKEKFAT